MHWEKPEKKQPKAKIYCQWRCCKAGITAIHFTKAFPDIHQDTWEQNLMIHGQHRDEMGDPADKAFSQHFYCRRVGIQTHFAKKGQTQHISPRVLSSLLMLLKKNLKQLKWLDFFLCNCQAKSLETSCQIYHSSLGNGWKRIKAFGSWLLGLSLHSFLLEYSRTEHGQCRAHTAEHTWGLHMWILELLIQVTVSTLGNLVVKFKKERQGLTQDSDRMGWLELCSTNFSLG